MIDFEELLSKYHKSYEVGKKIENKVKNKIYYLNEEENQEDMMSIINQIVLWKLNRIVELDDESMKSLLDLRKIKDIEEFLNNESLQLEVSKILEKLMENRGIRLAMATTFLHFFNEDVFLIIDKRAYYALYKKVMPESFNKPFIGSEKYIEYLKECYRWFKKLNIPNEYFKDVDKVLYQYDKNKRKILNKKLNNHDEYNI